MMDKIVKYRWFFFWDYDREEAWLNQMAKDGYELERYAFIRYTFRRGTPGAWKYKLEFLEHNPSDERGQDYLEFLKEAGIEPVCRWFRWVYLRQPAERGEFELFSDTASKLRYLRRLIFFFLPLAAANLLLGIANIFTDRGLNLGVGCLNLLLGVLFFWGMRRTFRLYWKLKKQQDIAE